MRSKSWIRLFAGYLSFVGIISVHAGVAGLAYEPRLGFGLMPATGIIGYGTDKSGKELDVSMMNSAQFDMFLGVANTLLSLGFEVNASVAQSSAIKLQSEQESYRPRFAGPVFLLADLTLHPFRSAIYGDYIEPYISLGVGRALFSINLKEGGSYEFSSLVAKCGLGVKILGPRLFARQSLHRCFAYLGLSEIAITGSTNSWGRLYSFGQAAMEAGVGADVPLRF